tara:strand:+ start:77 stop:529 length:453 start_codon:yes stop_codon:yes gene_type:complete
LAYTSHLTGQVKVMAKKTLRAKCLEAIQKLARISNADEYGMVNCVSCDKRMHWKDCDGGHYIGKGNSSYWALEICNVWPQCKGCNSFGMKHGSAEGQYTLWMIDYYDLDFVEQMHRDKHKPKKLYVSDYREMLKEFNDLITYHKKRLGEC